MVSVRGPIAATDLADALGLTATAVRRHLDALADDGTVVVREVQSGRRGRGRPAKHYVVTEAGHRALPSAYNNLATSALEFLARVAGREAVREFAERRAESFAASLPGGPGGPSGDGCAKDIRDRAELLAEGLRADGYAASLRPVQVAEQEIAVQLCQGHCPVQEVAREFPEICEAEAEAFSRFLGVHVQRLATLAHGEHVCTTHIPLHSIPLHSKSASPAKEAHVG